MGIDGAPDAAGRAWVLHPAPAGVDRAPKDRLLEAVGLAEAIRLDVRVAEAVSLRQPRPSTLIGKGKVDEIKTRLEAEPAELVVMDGALSPIQQRNLERAWKTKVIDRTGLILEIFGERARTREGTLQVELAALSYQRSRLVRSWTHLERQRGGFGFLGGPGESQLEIDRRRIDERIAQLKKELEDVRRTRGLHRDARARVPYPVTALVGYTNAGKSTLFNRLTGARVEAVDQLFATLDPTMRAVRLPQDRHVILSDTVGFISDLPTTLVAAFRATLEEVQNADVILHVRDISHPETERQREDVLAVLGELGLDEATLQKRLIEFWNKTDRLSAEDLARQRAEGERRDAVVLGSALTGDGCGSLLERISARISSEAVVVEVDLDPAAGALHAWLHRHGRVLERRTVDDRLRLRVALEPHELARLELQLDGDGYLVGRAADLPVTGRPQV